MGGRVLAVNVGALEQVEWSENQQATAIDKQPVTGPVKVHADRVGADVHGYQGHGGPDQAVYAYGTDDVEFWQRELDREFGPGAFGENLTVAGLPVSGAVSGERWKVGNTILEVTTPRIPCLTFAGFWNLPGLVKRFTAAGRPGAYFRVIQEGEISAGDPIQVLSQPNHGVTVADLLAARAGDRNKAAIIRTLDLPAKWHPWQASLGK